MRKIGAYLTRRNENYFLITKKPPVVMNVNGMDKIDAWPNPGERLIINHLCDYMVTLLGERAEKMEIGKSEKIWLSVEFRE